MRLRQLGTTQSVVFFAPPEVYQSILDTCKKSFGQTVDSYDVMCWLLEQTCDGIEALQPLYYSQGVDFCNRIQAGSDNPALLEDPEHRANYLSVLRKKEEQTLEQLYRPVIKIKGNATFDPSSPELAMYMKDLNARRKAFQDSGKAVHGSALQEVEQEREVSSQKKP